MKALRIWNQVTVTGSYEGKESFLKKLERIVAKNAQQKFEDEGADE